MPCKSVPAGTLADWLRQPFSIALSSGYFGFFAHTGCMLALADAGLRPQNYSGASAGALTAGFLACQLPEADMIELLRALRREDFWDPKPGLGLLRGKRFQDMLREMLPVQRIEDCPIPLAISVFDVVKRRTVVLRSGDLAAGIHASCAVPGLFQPVKIEGRYYLDGGILDKQALAGAPANTPVFVHHLASRTRLLRYVMQTERLAERNNLKTLTLQNLPRVSPTNLSAGHAVVELARQAAAMALQQSQHQAVYRVAA